MLKGKPVNEKHFTRYLCKLCNGFRTESTDALEMHISLHVNNKLNCHTCGFVANTRQNLACLVKQEHKTHRYIICEYCGFVLYSGRMYKDHLSKQHNKAGFECKTCELSFFTSNDYRQHKLRTHPESTFKCEKCGAIYLWKIALENHQNYKIDCEVKKYTVCQYCNFKSLRKGAVKQHIKRVHFKSKIYKCSMCPYAAVGSDQLKFHTRVHLGIHPFNCELCEFTFVKKWQLISHTRTHTGEKRYKCGQCNYASAWNCQLKTHLKAHESTARCACQICNIVFKDRKCLSTHVKKVHTTNSYYGPELQLTAHWDPTCLPLLQRRLIK